MSRAAIDMVGKRIGRLLVIERSPPATKCGQARWLCICDCGRTTTALGAALRNEQVRSCGCLGREARVKHGYRHTPEYSVWASMRRRCNSPGHRDYRHYGGRGIKICDRWTDFTVFLADMGARPSPKHTIERLDNDGPYSPENCVWATRDVQTKNTRRVHRIPLGENTISANELASLSGYSAVRVRELVRAGLTAQQIIEARQ